MVVSNGKLLETKENKDNTRTFHWKMEQPHASYLTSIVVGEYAAVEGSYKEFPLSLTSIRTSGRRQGHG